MKLAIFGDINDQYKSIERLLDKSERYGIDQYICHGDIARKACKHEPEKTRKCISSLKEHEVQCLRGNHEEDIIMHHHEKDIDIANFFSSLPRELVFDELELMISHYSPNGRMLIKPEPDEFDRLESIPQVRIAVFGHSHMRFHHSRNEKITANYHPKFNIPYDVSTGLHLINTGTTNFAFPFSFNLSPGYVIYDSEAKEIIFRRIK